MKRPLHYKRSITGSRLHVILAGLCVLTITEFGAAFYIYRKDTNLSAVRTTANVFRNNGLYSIFLVNFGLFTLVKAISFIWISVVLYKDNRIKSLDPDFKVTKALSFALGVHLCLYVPAVSCAFVERYVNIPHMIIVTDVCLLLFFMNTIVNPFIYFITMEDFRQGYKKFLLCKNTNEDQDLQIE